MIRSCRWPWSAGSVWCCLTGALAVASATAAEVQAVPCVSAQRPRVGLVLAGGGAKGGAHVGVLKVLEEMRVPIDCIAGTSMGALVGGGYASGIPAAGLEKFVTTIDWKSVVGGVGRRELQTIEQKRAGVTFSNDIEMGLKDKRVLLPAGIVNTSSIEDLLRTYVARSRAQSDFDKLPIPYRAVATDMVTGNMVVLASGDLATAMRASMAIPGAFAITPDDTLGAVIGDLNSKRGRVQGVEPQAGGNQKINAQVPMSEMLTYANQLTSLTSGRGLYSMELSQYEELPSHLTQKISAEREAHKKEKAEEK